MPAGRPRKQSTPEARRALERAVRAAKRADDKRTEAIRKRDRAIREFVRQGGSQGEVVRVIAAQLGERDALSHTRVVQIIRSKNDP